MNENDIKRLALVLAVQAEIEGMKAYNKQQEMDGAPLGYNESHFFSKADELRNLAHSPNQQVFIKRKG